MMTTTATSGGDAGTAAYWTQQVDVMLERPGGFAASEVMALFDAAIAADAQPRSAITASYKAFLARLAERHTPSPQASPQAQTPRPLRVSGAPQRTPLAERPVPQKASREVRALVTPKQQPSVVVLSAVRASAKQRHVLGAEHVLTPVRRSTRRPTTNAAFDEDSYAYAPNPAVLPSPVVLAGVDPSLQVLRAGDDSDDESVADDDDADSGPVPFADLDPEAESPDTRVPAPSSRLPTSPLPAPRPLQALGTPSMKGGARRVALDRPVAVRMPPPSPAAKKAAAAEDLAVVRASAEQREMLGSPYVVTPVRKSTRRRTPAAAVETTPAAPSSLEDKLERSGWSYVPPRA